MSVAFLCFQIRLIHQSFHTQGTASPCGWNKRGSKDSGQVHPAKKIKLAGGKPADTGKVKPSKADYDPLENEQIKPLSGTTPTTPKNEIPNRFWAFVEPYCAPLTQEDVKFVEDDQRVQRHG